VPRSDYKPEQVTMALAQLVADNGNTARTAEVLINDEFQVSEATLRRWRDDLHAEQYKRLQILHGDTLEQEAIAQARENLRLAGDKKRALLKKIDPEKTAPDQLAAVLKAVTDAEAKSTTGLLQLTGRPTSPTGDQSAGAVVDLLKTMAERGYLALAPGVSIEPPKRVVNEAESAQPD
jgi:hypothetical protein